MRTIYINNFRGFSDTYVDLLDVNFLVGENSSGKTSLLWATRLLNDPGFMFSLDFNATEAGLGHFQDLVSVGARDRSFFELGLINTHTRAGSDGRTTQREPPAFAAFLLRFAEKEGQPDVTECTFQRNSTWVNFKIQNRRAWVTVVHDMPMLSKADHLFKFWNAKSSAKTNKPRQVSLKLSAPFIFALADGLRQVRKTSTTGTLAPSDTDKQDFEAQDFPQTLFQMQDELTWIAPIRTKPKRTYDQYNASFSEEGEHTPYLIKRILSKKKSGPSLDTFLRRVGKASGLFETIGIRKYGRTATSPFELDVNLGSGSLGINNVGYGVSQSLPILVELHARPHESSFAIQQPEVHLHPKAQAALGELIFDAAASESKRFIIETHSDYMMDRFRMKMKNSNKRMSAQIVFFEHAETRNLAHQLTIGEDGRLPETQPEGYRSFFVNEALDTLGLG